MRSPSSPTRRSILVAVALVLPALASMGCSRRDNPFSDLMEPFYTPTPSQAARDAFNVYDADKRRASVNVLSAAPFGSEEAYLRMYRLLLDDADATVRGACVKALGLHGTVKDAELIVPRLSDPAPYVRWEAAKALQKIHTPLAVTPLVTAMSKDEDADVRMAAALALGQYPQPAVFNALVGALDDTDFGVNEAARTSLSTLTGQDFGTDGSLWLIWAQRRQARSLFEQQQQYVWQPYIKPRGFWDKAQFWKPVEIPSPRVPRGMEDQYGTLQPPAPGNVEPRG